ncbi:MAG: cyclodeaminase/cyclohydrolase family protein [Anaerolineae bacterium]
MDTHLADDLIHLNVADFVRLVAESRAVPGGGAAAALTGALAAALVAMVGRLSLGRAPDAPHEAEIQGTITAADALQARLLALVDADARAYQEVITAYRMPKETVSQQARRTGAIQTALRNATDLPLAGAELCLQTLELAEAVVAYSHRNTAGDAVVATMLAHAALRSQVHNALVNLAGIHDPHYRSQALQRSTEIAEAGGAALSRALAAADARA